MSLRLKGVAKIIRNEAGMTLIEIMVVLAIIGSIAALITVNVLSYLDESKVETTKIQIKNIEAALDQYKRRHGSYPTTEQGLSALVEKMVATSAGSNASSISVIRARRASHWSGDTKSGRTR